MPIIQPDLSDVQSDDPMEPGTYRARCKAASAETSKAGNPMIVLDSVVDYNGQTRTKRDWIVTTGKAAFKFDILLRACGFDELADKYKRKEQVPFDTDELVGQEYSVVIESDMYNGEPTDRVKTYLKN